MKVLKLKAVAEKMGIHINTVYVWMRDYGFPKSFMLGGTPVWDEAEIDQWVLKQKEKRDGSGGQTEGKTSGADVRTVGAGAS